MSDTLIQGDKQLMGSCHRFALYDGELWAPKQPPLVEEQSVEMKIPTAPVVWKESALPIDRVNESVLLLGNTLIALAQKSVVTVGVILREADQSADDQNLHAMLDKIYTPLSLVGALATRHRGIPNEMLRLHRGS